MTQFFVGEWVDIDPDNRVGRRNSSGGRAIIRSNQPSYNVRYLLYNHLSQDVDESRIHHSSLMTTSQHLSPNGEIVPSLLSYNYHNYLGSQQQLQHGNSTNRNHSLNIKSNTSSLITTTSLLKQSLQ
jgi:hypothetical protein